MDAQTLKNWKASTVVFKDLKPEERRDYLDGWGHETIGLPAKQPASPSKMFNRGVIEAKSWRELNAA
jgi:hypothetical protein